MWKIWTILMMGIASLALASPALSLDSIELPEGMESTLEAASGDAAVCPQLTRIKYPFLACGLDAAGHTVLTPFGTGLDSRVSNQSDFVTGNGYWGPER